jgi:hypothetical protein
MGVHNLKRGDRAFSLSLRRVVKVIHVLKEHHRYDVQAVDGDRIGAEFECHELVVIDARTQKKIDQLESLMSEMESLR